MTSSHSMTAVENQLIVAVGILTMAWSVVLAGCAPSVPRAPRTEAYLTGLPYSGRSFATLLVALDLNGDGAISGAELDAYLRERFSFMDADGDGTVTRQEFDTAELRDETLRKMKQEYLERLFGYLDSNGDGTFTKADFLEGGQQRFRGTDMDGDGRLTEKEWAGTGNVPFPPVGPHGRGRGLDGRSTFPY